MSTRTTNRPRWLVVLLARWRRYWHCLFRLHRPEDAWVGWRTVYVGCGCGRIFFEDTACLPDTGGSAAPATS